MMNPNNMIQMFQQIKQNPMQVLQSRFNIPQNVDMNNPNDIIQHLLNTGQITQQQVNQAQQMRNNPMIQQMFGRK